MKSVKHFIAIFFLVTGAGSVGPGLYAQSTVTKNGKTYHVYKVPDSAKIKPAKDTAKTKPVQGSAKSGAASAPMTMQMMPPPGGGNNCSMYGNAYPYIGWEYGYSVYCDVSTTISYWTTSSGSLPTVVGTGYNSIDLVWPPGPSPDELIAMDENYDQVASMTVNPAYPPLEAGSITPSTTSVCAGTGFSFSSGSATGGNGSSYAYQWQFKYESGEWQNISGATSPTYSATEYTSIYYRRGVTCASEVAYTSSVHIIVTSVIVPLIYGNNTVTCNGSTTLTTKGWNDTYHDSYVWYDNANTAVGTSSSFLASAGTYHVIGTTNGCSATSANFTLTNGTVPAPTLSSTRTVLCNSQTATISVTNAGNFSSYQWFRNFSGTPIPGEAGPYLDISSGGYYTCKGITNLGCGGGISEPKEITAVSLAPTIDVAGSPGFCQGGSVTLTANPGAATYQWRKNGSALSGYTDQAFAFYSGGSYTVLVTESHGCAVETAPVSVTVYPLPTAGITASGATTFCQGGSVTLTAPGGYSYAWSNGSTAQSIPVSTSGDYSVAVTNSSGCTVNSSVTTVTVNPAPPATITPSGATTFCTGGNVTLTAPAGYSYVWTGGSGAQSINVGATGSYAVTVTNGYGCTATSAATAVTVNPVPSATITPSGATTFCQGGSVTLTASGGNSYGWNNGSTAQSVVATSSGSNLVTVTNGYGCSATSANTYVTVNPLPSNTVSASGSTTFCQGGSVTLTAPAGYSYAWSNGATTQSITVSSSGSYSLTLNNGTGCTNTSSPIPVSVNDYPSVAAISGAAEVCAGSTGVFSNTTAGGVWTSSNTAVATVNSTGMITGIAAGTTTISYSVTNSGGCNTTVTKSLTVNAVPSLSVITGGSLIKVATQKQLSSSPSGGTWSSNNTTTATIDAASGIASALHAGTTVITYSLTNASGCTSSVTAGITAFDALQPVQVSPSVSAADLDGNGVNLQQTGNTSGGYGGYAYQWQASLDNSSWQNIAGATNNSYQPLAIANSSYYRLVVSSAGDTVQSNTALVSLALNGGIIGSSTATVSSGGSVTLQSVQDATGGSGAGTYTYQWQSSGDRRTWQTLGSLSVTNLTQLSYYRRQVSSNGVIAYSNDIRVRIREAASVLNTPGTAASAPAGTETVVGIPAYSGNNEGENRNFIRTRMITKPGVTDTATASALTNAVDVQQSTTYFDGLGRPEQTVAKQASATMKDLVSINIYDPLGREAQKYLPYTDGQVSGLFRTDADSKQPAFYNTQFGNTENYFYQNSVFEASPLNRVLKTTSPGNSFTGHNIGVSGFQRTNAIADSIRIWTAGTGGLPIASGRYLPGKLFIDETMDEHDNTVITVKDLEGHVVLKKVQESDALQPGHTGWLCTYYVYDDLGQLRHVLSPKAVQYAVANAWALPQAVADELCFSYTYDARQRMSAKKVPGAGMVYMIYDKRDRLVFTQDANMRAKTQWLYTLYDQLNRPVETGMMTGYSGTPADLQAVVNGQTGNGSITQKTTDITTPSSIPQDLVISSRTPGVGGYSATGSITFTDGFISEDNANFIAEIVTGGTAGSFTATTEVQDDPLPPGSTRIPLTLSSYDNYASTQKSFNNGFAPKLDAGNSNYAEAPATAASLLTRGMMTSGRVRILENPDDLTAGNWLESVTYFDEKGRAIQSQADNYKGGLETATTRYEFTGRPVSVYQSHVNGQAASSVKTKTSMDYDHMGRVTAIRKTLNDSVATTRTILINTYDELGQLKNKKIGQKRNSDGSFSSTPLENQDYAYNIRGWLKGINWNYTGSGATAPVVNITNNKWFAFDLSYDWGYSANQYNGNIAGQRWMSAGDVAERSFGYGYDNLNRILSADFNQRSSGWAKNNGGSATIDFSMKMGDGLNSATAYDANGNILKMQQQGLKLVTSPVIDALNYVYSANSNKLLSVSDTVTADNKLGDFTDKNSAGNDYGYDANGNMVTDLNKRLNGGTGLNASGGAITYNHLNLPWQIAVKKDDGSAKGTITYIYDATGNKLEKRTVEGSLTTRTAYIGGYVYQNDTLQFLPHEEGRVRKKPDNSYVFDYFLKDHLGNTRMVLTDEAQRDVYPIATMESSNSALENTYYSNIDATRTGKPAGYPADTTWSNPNNYVAKLNGNGNKIGPSIVLRVMSGDTISIHANNYYQLNGSPPGTPANPLNDLLAALANGIAGAAGGTKFTPAQLQQGNVLTPGINDLLTRKTNDYAANATKPKAYLNWILFDDQFQYVANSSGFEQVGAESFPNQWVKPNLLMQHNGYLYVYTSNESPVDVFFDNLQVVHNRGPLMEETHYYPFGLTMAGISSKAAGKLENRYKFNGGTERDSDLDINLDETDFRLYDPQIGRFHQIDPLADFFEDLTPYAYVGNNPILYCDPLGLSKSDGNTLPEVVVTGIRHKKGGTATEGNAPKSLPGNAKPSVFAPVPTPKAATDNTATQAGKGYKHMPNHLEGGDHIKDFLEIVGKAAERGELITEVTGSDQLLKSFKAVGYIATATTFGYQLMKGDAKGAALTGAEAALSVAVPEYNVFKIGGAIFTSKFTLTKAFFNAQSSKNRAIYLAHQWADGSSERKRLIEYANEHQRAMTGLIQMRISQLSDQSK